MRSNFQGWVGKSLKRREDLRLLTGDTAFVDDIELKDTLHVAVLRSTYAHARITRLEATEALLRPGVVAIVHGEDAKSMSKPLPAYAVAHLKPEEYCLAVGKVRYVGEPVVAVAAKDRGLAEDALEFIDVAYEPLEPILDPEKAMQPAGPLVYDSFGTNVVAQYKATWGDVDQAFTEADLIVTERLKLHSYSSTPLETVACIASYNMVSRDLTIYSNTQMVGHVIPVLSDSLGIPTERIRFIVQDIGGGFGLKTRPWKPLLIACLLSVKTGRPVKYVEDRREHLLAAGRTAAAIFDCEVAVKNDGSISGFRLRDINDDGASLTYAGTYGSMHATLINGCYRVRNVAWESYSVLTNKCPSMPNRGVGKPGICYVVERMIDIVGRRLGIDPIEVRRRNYIEPNEFPYATPSGRVYDSGNYEATLRRALQILDYETVRKEQSRLRGEGRYIGVGLSTYVHGASATAQEIEGTTIKMDSRGRVTVLAGSPDMGTGHKTALSQIIADELGITPEDINVLEFDSQVSPWTPYSGTHANKFSGPDVESAVAAAGVIRDKLLKLAAHMLDSELGDLVLRDGRVYVKSRRERFTTVGEVAKMAYQNPGFLPPDTTPGLAATCILNSPRALESFVADEKYTVGAIHQLVAGRGGSPTSFMTYPNSAHIAVVEVDIETGQVEILRYIVVHDSGKVINPMLAEAQVHGGALHGIGATLLEEFVYDSNGQLLTSTFMDYLKPTSLEAPHFEVEHLETPSPRSVLGIKGIGEGEALGPLAAIGNAVDDALSPFNVKITELPITPERVHRLIKQSSLLPIPYSLFPARRC
ncbi:MAG: xanthine dehydrogenase family protein molybdopterin-binding subunit [Acidobacteria bacterium]|nr:xanthine dehydrogenase family protein molybdopterin-binding subunit [Acidobacteriota bacterium]